MTVSRNSFCRKQTACPPDVVKACGPGFDLLRMPRQALEADLMQITIRNQAAAVR